MKAFKDYLINRKIISEKVAPYYISWISNFYSSISKEPGIWVESAEIDQYLFELAKEKENWQVDQAKKAINLYLFFIKKTKNSDSSKNSTGQIWKMRSAEMKNILRLKHLAYRTEQTYLSWLRRFYYFVEGKTPELLNQNDLKDFLTHLAVEKKVAATTQNQAFNAILFFYRHVINVDIEDIHQTVRAKTSKRLPTVLTSGEVKKLFNHLGGTHLLMAKIIYGGGLRLNECLRLRIKDIDIERKFLGVTSPLENLL